MIKKPQTALICNIPPSQIKKGERLFGAQKKRKLALISGKLLFGGVEKAKTRFDLQIPGNWHMLLRRRRKEERKKNPFLAELKRRKVMCPVVLMHKDARSFKY